MGLAGVSGPFRGAYITFDAATSSMGINLASTGAVNAVMWSYTVPPGMDLVVVDAQFYSGTAGTPARVNVLAGGASILADIPAGTRANGVGLTTDRSVVATPSTALFGTTATGILNTATPSTNIQAPRFFGAYITSGATLSVTASNGATAGSGFQGTLLCYPVSHPNVVRSTFE